MISLRFLRFRFWSINFNHLSSFGKWNAVKHSARCMPRGPGGYTLRRSPFPFPRSIGWAWERTRPQSRSHSKGVKKFDPQNDPKAIEMPIAVQPFDTIMYVCMYIYILNPITSWLFLSVFCTHNWQVFVRDMALSSPKQEVICSLVWRVPRGWRFLLLGGWQFLSLSPTSTLSWLLWGSFFVSSTSTYQPVVRWCLPLCHKIIHLSASISPSIKLQCLPVGVVPSRYFQPPKTQMACPGVCQVASGLSSPYGIVVDETNNKWVCPKNRGFFPEFSIFFRVWKWGMQPICGHLKRDDG